jgi:hypothetical protein
VRAGNGFRGPGQVIPARTAVHLGNALLAERYGASAEDAYAHGGVVAIEDIHLIAAQDFVSVRDLADIADVIEI